MRRKRKKCGKIIVLMDFVGKYIVGKVHGRGADEIKRVWFGMFPLLCFAHKLRL